MVLPETCDISFFFGFLIFAPALRATLNPMAIAWALGFPAFSSAAMFLPMFFFDADLINGIIDIPYSCPHSCLG
jgi:hypothetical protein